MARGPNALRSLKGQASLQLVLGLGGAIVVLVLVAILGAIKVSNDHGSPKRAVSSAGAAAVGPGVGNAPQSAEGASTTTVAGQAAASAPAAPAAGGSASGGAGSGGSGAGGSGASGSQAQSATRIGVFPDHVEWGLHGPVTVNGAPLGLAKDPLEGVDIFLTALNNSGGINGRKIHLNLSDDKYTTDGAAQAADVLINDKKVFLLSGTLGVDQVAVVARAASQAKPFPVPYMAAGASETQFKAEHIQMYQVAGSYDTHLKMLASLLAKEVQKSPANSIYSGRKEIAVSALNSPYILPVIDAFRQAVQANGLVWKGSVTVPKFTDPNNTHNYADQIQKLKSTFTAGGIHGIVIPAQDPLTTQFEVQQCIAQGCGWKWSFSDFAHDEDLALELANNGSAQWAGVRGLSGGCYYQAYNTAGINCGHLKQAHDAWVSVKGQSDWDGHGQAGIAGYQLVHFWIGAMKNAGVDLTRERVAAALAAYDHYDDLVTGPISFAGSSNTVHGIDVMAVYEGQANNHWKMISNGLVGSF